jgi:hypothetical protein
MSGRLRLEGAPALSSGDYPALGLSWRLPVPRRAPPRRSALSDNPCHTPEPNVNRTTPIRFFPVTTSHPGGNPEPPEPRQTLPQTVDDMVGGQLF